MSFWAHVMHSSVHYDHRDESSKRMGHKSCIEGNFGGREF